MDDPWARYAGAVRARLRRFLDAPPRRRSGPECAAACHSRGHTRPRPAVSWRLALHGEREGWRLEVDVVRLTSGTDADCAVVATLRTLTELGCRTAERLLVVHGVALDGNLIALGLPLCIKQGSWPALASRLPELARVPALQRRR